MSGGAVFEYGPGAEATARRVQSVLGVAGAHRTGVPVSELTELLPGGSPSSSADLERWIEAHPSIGRVVGERAYAPGLPPVYSDLDERRARGRRFLERAEALPAGPLRTVRPLLRALAVTGSTAYGEPEAGDDLDFLAITRSDSMWVFLTFTYVRLRLRRMSAGDGEDPGPCFNYVMEDGVAEEVFRTSRGLLFAREALTSRPLVGAEYYRHLVRSGEWMREELPRLFARWQAEPCGAFAAPARTPLPVRILNRLLYPLVASYLQLQGLMRNHRLRAHGHGERSFRTVASYRRLMFATDRFEVLRRAHEVGSSPEGLGA